MSSERDTQGAGAEGLGAEDDFFTDEQELMEAAAGVGESDGAGDNDSAEESGEGPAEGSASGSSGAGAVSDVDAGSGSAAAAAPVRTAPPFWMVLAIAAVALVLGIVIGYLVGTATTVAQMSTGSASGETTATSTGLPEGHPDLDIAEDGTATLADGSDSSGATATDADAADAADADETTEDANLVAANTYFDQGMSALMGAEDEDDAQAAAMLFNTAVGYYDTYLASNSSDAAEVDRAICVYYSGKHEDAIADLEAFVKKNDVFAPAWANLGMFYEAHGDTDQAKGAYQKAIDLAADEDTYNVKDFAQEHLDALNKSAD